LVQTFKLSKKLRARLIILEFYNSYKVAFSAKRCHCLSFNIKRERSSRINGVIKLRVFQLDAFATPKLKKDFEKLKADCEEMKNERSALLSEIDVLRARCVSMEERLEVEREDHRKALDQLRDECKFYITYLFIFFESLSRIYTYVYIHTRRDDAIRG